ncbi:MAG: ABC-F family ATP-binding cassette domain-containing protein [Candidatus Hydrogenedentes bacterium]|nr:ABC-F family ATP-binding cassette domain-containing protein [Candidatus Hydrogenedentota bacterium]
MAPPVSKALLSVKNIVHSYGSQPVLDDISLTIHEGERIGLIGRNGCGKSTLLGIMTGRLTPDRGEVVRRQNIRVALMEQQCAFEPALRVGEVMQAAIDEITAMQQRYAELNSEMGTVDHESPRYLQMHDELEEVQHQLDASGGWHIDTEIKRISQALNLVEPDRVMGSLSGGELRRVDLALKLIRHPDVLLLDEPTNHIDTRSVEWIESFLERYEGSCVLVTHDRYFLDRVTNRIVELDFNKVYSFPGNYERFLEFKCQVEDSNARTEKNRLDMIRREWSWYKRGPKARTGKQKARMDRIEDMVDQGPPPAHREFCFEIPEPERLGKTILECRKLQFSYGDKPLIAPFNFIMKADMRVGIIGPNGCGKSTLIQLLMSHMPPTKGHLIVGDSTHFLYVGQTHDDIDPEKSPLAYVTGTGGDYHESGKRRIYIPAYLEKFLFDKSALRMPMGQLSGGERNRIALTKHLLRGGNFLVLDEPTNDLDLYTLRILEETLSSFTGCALIVSHDRYFLNRICTHMLVFEEGGHIVEVNGNYDDYQLYVSRRAEQRAADAAASPATGKKPSASPGQASVRKLSYQEKQELAAMEATILSAEERVASLEKALQAPGFYDRGHEKVTAALAALQAAKESATALYARWEWLEAAARGEITE